MELILTEVELGITEIQDEDNNSFDVWYNKRENRFVAINPITHETYRYKMTKSIEDIIFELHDEILEYRLCKVTPEDTVGIGDIFMYGKYVELIK